MEKFMWVPSAPLFDKGVPRQHQKGGQRLMKPVPIHHNEYRGFLRKKLREYYTDFSSISMSTPVRFCNFSARKKCHKMAGKSVQPLDNYTCRFRPSSLKCTDKSGLDGLQAGK